MQKRERLRIRDPQINLLRRSFAFAKAQALHRGQEWSISWEYYLSEWLKDDKISHKGDLADQFVNSRKNLQEPWTEDNFEITTRHESCARKKTK